MANSHDHSHLRHMAVQQHAERIHEIQRDHRAHGGRGDEAADKILVTKGVHDHEKAMHKGSPLTHLNLRDGGHAEGHSGRHRLDRARRADGGKVDSIYRDRNGGEGASNSGKGRDASGEKDAARMHAEQKRDVDHYARDRFADGGHTKRGGKASHVNVIVAPGQGPARPVPIPVPAAGIGGAPPPRPPMPPMGAGGPPMGGPPPGGMPGAGMPPRPGMPMPMAPGGIRRNGGRAGRADGGSIEKEAGEPHPPFSADPEMRGGAQGALGRLEKTKSARKIGSAAVAGD